MVKQSPGTIYAKIDNSRSLFSGLLSPGSVSSSEARARTNACFSGPGLMVEEEPDTMTPLVGNNTAAVHSVTVTYSGPETGHGGPGASVLRCGPTSARESKV